MNNFKSQNLLSAGNLAIEGDTPAQFEKTQTLESDA